MKYTSEYRNYISKLDNDNVLNIFKTAMLHVIKSDIGAAISIVDHYDNAIGKHMFVHTNTGHSPSLSAYMNKYIMPMLKCLNMYEFIRDMIYKYTYGVSGNDLIWDSHEGDFVRSVIMRTIDEYTCNNRDKEDIKMSNNNNGKDKVASSMMDKIMPRRIENGEVALTFNGSLAVKREDGDYVSYDKDADKIVNNMQFIIDSDRINRFIFLMPTMQLGAGDIIKYNGSYCYIKQVDNGSVKAINLSSGTKDDIVGEVNIMLGATAYSKVVSIFNMFNMNADNQSSTGIMGAQFNPMMLMLLDRDTSDDNIMEMMLMSQMLGGRNPFASMSEGL